jgi:hypothetical protein
MNLIINKFFGRLGNNITQIQNSLHIALFYNYNIILPYHKFFNTNYIIINENINIENDRITDDYNFFFINKIKNINFILFSENKDSVIKILRTIFVINYDNKLDDNDLLIHIRSGDIFTISPSPFENYIPPPLSYYTEIINKNNYENIYVVCEDYKNPCINKLLEIYPNIIFKIQSLEEDIMLILSAVNIVQSVGSFIPALCLFSKNIKKVYKPTDFDELKNYYLLMDKWKNTSQQIDLILNYKLHKPMKIKRTLRLKNCKNI